MLRSNLLPVAYGLSPTLPFAQRHLIQPNIVLVLIVVAIELEGDVNLIAHHAWLGTLVSIHTHRLAIHNHRDVVHLPVDAFKLPDQMMPAIGRKWSATNLARHPLFRLRVPDVPFVGIFEVAFRSPGIACSAKGLVHVEFQCLGNVRIIYIEPEVILKMRKGVICVKCSPPERVGITFRSADIEAGR